MRGAKIVLSTLRTLDSALAKVPNRRISLWLERHLVTTKLAKADLLLARAADSLTLCSATINSIAVVSSLPTLASVDPRTIEHLQKRNSTAVLGVSELSYNLGLLEQLLRSGTPQRVASWAAESQSQASE